MNIFYLQEELEACLSVEVSVNSCCAPLLVNSSMYLCIKHILTGVKMRRTALLYTLENS